MVRGLVEQQHVGADRQRAGKRGACQLPAGEARQRTRHVVLGEPEPGGHLHRARAPEVAAARLEPRLRAGVTGQQRLVALPPGHPCLEPGELGLDRELLGAAG